MLQVQKCACSDVYELSADITTSILLAKLSGLACISMLSASFVLLRKLSQLEEIKERYCSVQIRKPANKIKWLVLQGDMKLYNLIFSHVSSVAVGVAMVSQSTTSVLKWWISQKILDY